MQSAIHVEVLCDTSSAELAMALRRFFALYRVPSFIYMDNLSSHVALKRWCLTKDSSNDGLPPPLQNLANLYRITFLCITPLSPWKGGMYERMIGLLKTALRKMGSHITSLSVFHTLIAEATLLVNSRPLTPLNEEHGEVITPRHFLFPYRGTLGDKGTYTLPETVKSGPDSLILAWKELNRHITLLWRCWSEEYLQALRERNTVGANSRGQVPKKGEVVLCTEMTKDRRKWHLGIITDLRKDSDGVIRSVVVRHPDRKTYARPPEALIPLELRLEEQ
ncbi:unnamed protein product [Auanema sp. JU1783]|nr:unnamed protein product [Auanema sp. JU1783]